jgi:flagellin
VAINTVNSQRGTFGAVQNRFENVVANLMVGPRTRAAARSRIMDADYAAETANMSRAQILQQAGNAMVAQANQLPQQVLSLLQR